MTYWLRARRTPSLLIASFLAACSGAEEVEIVAFDLPDDAAACLAEQNAQPGTLACLFVRGVPCAFMQPIDASRSTELNAWDASSCSPGGVTFSPDDPLDADAFFVASSTVCTGLSFGDECIARDGCYARYQFAYTAADAVEGGSRLTGIGDSVKEGTCTSLALCGDGRLSQIDRTEECDDGNVIANDGCSYCFRNRGFICEGEPSLCTADCGDGLVVRDFEGCDDGNDVAGDGCDPDTCEPEPGYACTGEPSVCQQVCGQGGFQPEFGETCDDGNVTDNDGCSASCQQERGWTCNNTGLVSTCEPTECGDGVLVANENFEACDDGNDQSGDGCDDQCKIEPFFDCVSNRVDEMPENLPDSVCDGICGDGEVVGSETCDPPDAAAGCDNTCQALDGWTCTAGACSPNCGDARVVGDEACDDGNTDSGDGCSENDEGLCVVEDGWDCPDMGGACSAICGDGKLRDTETCDDLNILPGDGCSAQCTIEPGWDCVKNDPDDDQEPSTCARLFAFTPANFSPVSDPGRFSDWRVTGACTVDTGADGATPVFTGTCGTGTPEANFVQSEVMGVRMLVLQVRNFNISQSGSLGAVGSRPLIISAYGSVAIGGTLTVSGALAATSNATPAAASANCINAAGNDADADTLDAGGGGGGGYGGAGGTGGDGNNTAASGGGGNAARGNETLVPLFGGCSGKKGGDGVGNTGGAGGSAGGAIQISASQLLEVDGDVSSAGAGGVDGETGSKSSGGGGGGSGRQHSARGRRSGYRVRSDSERGRRSWRRWRARAGGQ